MFLNGGKNMDSNFFNIQKNFFVKTHEKNFFRENTRKIFFRENTRDIT